MKRLVVVLLLATPLFSNWQANFTIVKGEKIKKGSKTFYVISPGKSATMILDKDLAFRLSVTNPGNPNTLYILNGGKAYKEFPIKAHETLELSLKKGDYELKNAKDFFYFRIYTWQKQALTPVPPVGDGNPLTLQTDNKKFAYYSAAKDKNLTFKITGPATFYLYARPDFSRASKAEVAAEFIIRGLEGTKDIFSKKFMAKPSKTASYLEQKEIIPGGGEKIKLELTPGVHEIRVFFEKGKGRVRAYVEEKGKKKPKATGPLRLGIRGGLGYDSNPFRFSQQNIDIYNSGLKTDRFPDVVSLQDAFFLLEANIAARYKNLQLSLRPRFTFYAQNTAKNYASYSFDFELKNRVPVGVNFFYDPDFYLFPVTVVTILPDLRKQYTTYPLHYKQVKAGLRIAFFNLGIGSYTFSPAEQFSYLNAKLYYGGVGGALHVAGLRLRPSFDLCLTDASSKLPMKDWSNISFQPGLDVGVGPAWLRLDAEFRKYLAKEPLDLLHYGRHDILIKARLEFRAHLDPFNLYPFVEYNQRFVSGAVSPSEAQLLKAYVRFRAGLNVQFNII